MKVPGTSFLTSDTRSSFPSISLSLSLILCALLASLSVDPLARACLPLPLSKAIMVDWQNPVIVLNDLGASVKPVRSLSSSTSLFVHSSFFRYSLSLGRCFDQTYTRRRRNLSVRVFFFFLAPDPLLLLPRLNVLLFIQNPCYCYQLGVRLQSRL